MKIPMQYNYFGFKYLAPLRSGSRRGFHPGVDLNWKKKGGGGYDDFGLPISAIEDGKVVYSSFAGSGWGRLIVIEHEIAGKKVWSRYAHLHKVYVGINKKVTRGQVIGTCGMTGTKAPHLHFDVIIKKLNKWHDYIWDWPKSKVELYYTDPLAFIAKHSKIPDWAQSAWDKAEAAGIAPDDPFDEVGTQLMQIILKDAGVIKEIGKIPVYRFLVVLEKMKIL